MKNEKLFFHLFDRQHFRGACNFKAQAAAVSADNRQLEDLHAFTVMLAHKKWLVNRLNVSVARQSLQKLQKSIYSVHVKIMQHMLFAKCNKQHVQCL